MKSQLEKIEWGGRRPNSGRPKLPKRDSRTEITVFRLSSNERSELEKAAQGAGTNLSTWVRETLLYRANAA